ncbi:dehydration-responsive element-binding protein 1A-like [Silene latifolia]|uniref:dehydration-responsive element-binding protein 1A-like n=1 Tax=Silene latifolia TaxID=37657 RepID=UPI003D773BBD
MSHINNNNNNLLPESSNPSPSTGNNSGGLTLMLASAHPKKRAGRQKVQETRHPVYRGVRLRKSGKWVSEVRLPNNKDRLWLGTYLTPEMAARAHDVAAIALRGHEGACLNFADSVWRLPVPASSDNKDIQKAAAEAAMLFRPTIEPLNVQPPPPPPAPPPLKEENEGYMDEDMVFNMPGVMADMYEGLGMSLPPQQPSSSCCCSNENDDVDFEDDDISLWSHSL